MDGNEYKTTKPRDLMATVNDAAVQRKPGRPRYALIWVGPAFRRSALQAIGN
jgi:hypothetical protein